jgi:hypothetical protein
MRLLIGVGVFAAAWLAATPGLAGVGQCVWEHLPQADRDRAFAPPGAALTLRQTAESLPSRISGEDEVAAMTACGVAAKDEDAATGPLASYMLQHYAEHWLFLNEPHLWPQQLDRAWSGVDPNLVSRIRANVVASQNARASVDAALGPFEKNLAIHGALSSDAEDALRYYIGGRVSREVAEAALSH